MGQVGWDWRKREQEEFEQALARMQFQECTNPDCGCTYSTGQYDSDLDTLLVLPTRDYCGECGSKMELLKKKPEWGRLHEEMMRLSFRS